MRRERGFQSPGEEDQHDPLEGGTLEELTRLSRALNSIIDEVGGSVGEWPCLLGLASIIGLCIINYTAGIMFLKSWLRPLESKGGGRSCIPIGLNKYWDLM